MTPARFQKLVLAALGALLLSVTASPACVSQLPAQRQSFLDRFVAAAVERTHHTVRYDSAYVRIPYPVRRSRRHWRLHRRSDRAYAPLASTCKEKSTKTWQIIFPRIPEMESLQRRGKLRDRFQHRSSPRSESYGLFQPARPIASAFRLSDRLPSGDLVTWNLAGNNSYRMVVNEKSPQTGRN